MRHLSNISFFIIFLSICIEGFAQQRDSIGFIQSVNGPDLKFNSKVNLGTPPLFISPQNFLIPSFSFRRAEKAYGVSSLDYSFSIYDFSLGVTSVNKFDHGFSLTLIPLVSFHSTDVSELFDTRGIGLILVTSLGYKFSDQFEVALAFVYSRRLNANTFLPGGSLKFLSNDRNLSIEVGYPRSRLVYFINPKVEIEGKFLIDNLLAPLAKNSHLQTATGFYAINSRQMSLGSQVSWNIYERLWLTLGTGWIFYDKLTGQNRSRVTISHSSHTKDYIAGYSGLGLRF